MRLAGHVFTVRKVEKRILGLLRKEEKLELTVISHVDNRNGGVATLLGQKKPRQLRGGYAL